MTPKEAAERINIVEPSAERVERAARAIDPLCWREYPLPLLGISHRRDESMRLARAALTADAPALIEAIIDELKIVRDISRETEWVETIEEVTSDRIASLQADLDKERGK